MALRWTGLFTRERYEILLSAVRMHPSINAAAKSVNISPGTLSKYYNHGHPDYEWARPLKEVLADEDLLVREKVAKEKLEEFDSIRRREMATDEKVYEALDREVIKRDAIMARVEEAKLVRAARSGGLQVLAALLRMGPGIQKISERMGTELALMAAKEGINVRMALGIIRSYTLAMREANTAASQAMEMERLYLGEPTEIIGFADTTVDSMSLEDCAREVQEATAAMGRAEAMGLVVMAGGKGKS